MTHLPFQPRRHQWIALLLPAVFACVLVLTALMYPTFRHKSTDLAKVLCFDGLLHGALLLAIHEELRFDPQGIERVAGVRRHRIEHQAIRSVEISRSGAEQPVLLIDTSYGEPVKIRFDFYAPGEGQKMLRVLREHAPDARWNEAAIRLLDSKGK